jgi:hypothetical protein
MCYHLKTPQGNTEAVIDDNCGISKFYAIADTLCADLDIIFLKQVDDAESLDWEFQYKNHYTTAFLMGYPFSLYTKKVYNRKIMQCWKLQISWKKGLINNQ